MSMPSQNCREFGLNKMRKLLIVGVSMLLVSFTACTSGSSSKDATLIKDGEKVTISKKVLQEKIKGGWAGQVIGCTYGGPTEFQWLGTMIGDHVPIKWDEHQMKWWYGQCTWFV